MTTPILTPLKPLPIKDRISVVYVVDVIDGAFVVVDKTGVRTHIPIGAVACLMLEPGARVSHSAVVLAARVGCLLVWTVPRRRGDEPSAVYHRRITDTCSPQARG